MRPIGFSTGALALGDFQRAVQMLRDRNVRAIELSALRQYELEPLVSQIPALDVRTHFVYVSFHAPSSMATGSEGRVLEQLQLVASYKFPIIVHPDVISDFSGWRALGKQLCIENMDKRKPIGQTAEHLKQIFEKLPDASFCLDLGHVRQVDPTMTEAGIILECFGRRLTQLHVSEVNSQSRHDPLTLESMIAFKRVAHLIPDDVPVILESRVPESEINTEITVAQDALDPRPILAMVAS